MKKEEAVALIGKERISGWWTAGRVILAIIAVESAVLAVFFLLGFDFRLDFSIRGLFIILSLLGIWEALLIFGTLFGCSRIVHDTNLKIEKIDENGAEVKVLGKDGQEHTVFIDKIWIRKNQKTSYVHLSGELKYLQSDLVIGSNINEIWGK